MFSIIAPKKRRLRFGRVLPPPERSTCMYVQIAPRDVAMFRFLLEAEDNLGYMSVVDRWSAALKVIFSPHQEKELRAWLEDAKTRLSFKEIWPARKNAACENGNWAEAERPELKIVRKGL